jgi:phosphoglycolate phosphatase-like HAD superfamily hydrolase|tara:strand:+ start:272 stop:934 length:663 start_codon:yes stop_codon:yes gene_type:complete
VIEAIIFDFDGVITESVGVKANGFAMLYEPYGNNVVNKVLTHHHANGGVSRYHKFRFYHREFLGSDLSDDEMEDLGRRFSEFVVERIIEAPYVRGALEFLKSAHNQYDLFISTGTPQAEIEMIIRAKGIEGFFKAVFGSPQKKSDHIEVIMRTHHYSTEQVVFVGDSVQDKDAANEQRLAFIARLNDGNSPLKNEPHRISDLNQLEIALAKMNGSEKEYV